MDTLKYGATIVQAGDGFYNVSTERYWLGGSGWRAILPGNQMATAYTGIFKSVEEATQYLNAAQRPPDYNGADHPDVTADPAHGGPGGTMGDAAAAITK